MFDMACAGLAKDMDVYPYAASFQISNSAGIYLHCSWVASTHRGLPLGCPLPPPRSSHKIKAH